MNRIYCLLLFTCFLLASACNNSTDGSNARKDLIDPATIVHNPRTFDGISAEEAATLPALTFTDTIHSFGTIQEGESVSYEFSFKNDGKTPLLIANAEGSCGCTVADYPRQPLPPGQSASVKVIFNSAGKPGHQEKDVAITANTLRGVHHLYITAEVNPQ